MSELLFSPPVLRRVSDNRNSFCNLKKKHFCAAHVETAQKSNCFPVIVVLGANFEKIKNEIKDLDCEIVFNTDWQTGMSSSIKIGVKKMLEIAPEISAVIIALCDQPFIKSEHFNKLVEKFLETKKPIVAGFYNETIGVPALFAKEMFSASIKSRRR